MDCTLVREKKTILRKKKKDPYFHSPHQAFLSRPFFVLLPKGEERNKEMATHDDDHPDDIDMRDQSPGGDGGDDDADGQIPSKKRRTAAAVGREPDPGACLGSQSLAQLYADIMRGVSFPIGSLCITPDLTAAAASHSGFFPPPPPPRWTDPAIHRYAPRPRDIPVGTHTTWYHCGKSSNRILRPGVEPVQIAMGGVADMLLVREPRHTYHTAYTSAGDGGFQKFAELQPGTVRSVAVGERHCAAVAGEHGMLYVWGVNTHGQLGDAGPVGTTVTKPSAMKTMPSNESVVAVACGHSMTVVRTQAGSLYACGQNSWGQLGVASTTDHNGLVLVRPFVPGGARCTHVACGSEHVLAISEGDSCVWAWGRNTEGQLGISDETSFFVTSPTRVVHSSRLMRASHIACGGYRSIAAHPDFGVFTWGLGSALTPEQPQTPPLDSDPFDDPASPMDRDDDDSSTSSSYSSYSSSSSSSSSETSSEYEDEEDDPMSPLASSAARPASTSIRAPAVPMVSRATPIHHPQHETYFWQRMVQDVYCGRLMGALAGGTLYVWPLVSYAQSPGARRSPDHIRALWHGLGSVTVAAIGPNRCQTSDDFADITNSTDLFAVAELIYSCVQTASGRHIAELTPAGPADANADAAAGPL